MPKEFVVLSIYGIGGLGKTTMAKNVFNNSQFRSYSQVWIYVSQTFDLRKIGNSIISQLSKEKSKHTDLQMIHNSLRELLASKKIMIVLDDIWEDTKSHLDELMDMLKVGKSGNVVVIVTTRSKDIAMKVSTIQPHKLESLTDEMCWTIIKQNSAFELRNDQEYLEQIGKDIASKCGGVPLAAQSLGHMLHSLTFDQWESIRNSDIWNVSDSEDTSLKYVLASLRLSYSAMPSNLKLCFAYCATFTKGYKIVKDDLIQQWISLDFIKATNIFSTWQIGDKYIRQLVGLSFLEHSASTTEADFENDRLFIMHDLVHDLARSVMVDEIFLASKQGNTGGSCYHFALLNDDCRTPLDFSKIRALRFMECGETELLGAAFSSAKSLRVLDLSECSINKLPDSIGALKQLRYLHAPGVQHATIPHSITKLSKLFHLNLQGSPTIVALPESIGDMKCLVYLDFSGCSGIKFLPESFGGLKELVHLDFSNCTFVGGISEFLGSLTELKYLNLSYCRNIGKLPEALGGLSKLQYLNLSFSSYLECCEEAEFLGGLVKLEYLNLSSKQCPLQKLPEALDRLIQLKYLNLKGCSDLPELPKLFRSLNFLEYLNLSNCYMIDRLDEALVGLLNLRYLNLHATHTSDSLVKHISCNLFNLEHLDLSSNSIMIVPESICNLRKLHTLDLSRCLHLLEIPESIGTIDSLRFLYAESLLELPQLGSSAVSLPYHVVHPGNGDSSSNLVHLEYTDPDVLRITKLENVKSAAEAQHVKLMGKQKLVDLKLEWTGQVARFVDDKMLLDNLVPPSTLKKLEICGYNGSSFPAWLVGHIPSLGKLVLRGMAGLVEWDTSHSNGDEHVIERLEIHDCPMLRIKQLPPKAKSWEITNSDNVLSSWGECTMSHTNASSTSTVTTSLSVKYFQVPLHQWRLLQHFPGLSCLSIDSRGDLTGSPETSQHLSSVETLRLEAGDLEELPKWMGELPSLQRLGINGSRVLKGLNENMRQLTKLQYLELYHCDVMTSLPYWLDELISLKELYVGGCSVLRSLPESIHQLTSLQKIEIGYCPELKHIVKPEKGKMKVTHNQEGICVLPTSLVQLRITKCGSIKSLPEGIEELTNLQTLHIRMCPELKQWCEQEDNKMKLAHIRYKASVLSCSMSY
ncbi:hypothetical protein ACQ4PT_060345 [Festuca glaucescens]